MLVTEYCACDMWYYGVRREQMPAYRVLVRNMKEKGRLQDLAVDVRAI